MRNGSIRLRITLLAAAIVSVVLMLTAVAVVVVVQSQLRENLDRSLEQRADQIEQSLPAESSPALVNSNREDRFVQVLDAEGTVVLATDNVAGEPPLAELPADGQTARTRSDLPLEDDVYRVLIHQFDQRGEPHYIVVGENIDDLQDSVRALIVTLAIVFPVAVLALAVTVWWLVGRTLQPVEQIRREVAGIGLGELQRRVPVPGSGDEVDRLADTMNGMLARLESSSAHQRRFVADVSHELRSPLTRIRTALEVDLASEDADLAETCRSVLVDSIDMQALVDDLLYLARRDAGEVPIVSELIDLDVVIDDEVRRARAETDAADVTIDMNGVSAVAIGGDRRGLARLVRNVVSNAVRHAGRSVVITAEHDADGSALLTIDDDGPGVPVADRERVFERFVRLDESRHRSAGGTGLGLAIALDIARAHGGSIEIADSPLGGARFVVTLAGSG